MHYCTRNCEGIFLTLLTTVLLVLPLSARGLLLVPWHTESTHATGILTVACENPRLMARLPAPLPLLPLCPWPLSSLPYPLSHPSLSTPPYLPSSPTLLALAASHMPLLGAGGAAEAEAAYEEAFDAIFNLAVESYRHPIPQISKKNGQQKWSMIEMWPMSVSVCDLHVCLSVCLSVSLSLCLFVCLSVCGTVCLLLLGIHRYAFHFYRLGRQWHQSRNLKGCFVSMHLTDS